MNQPTITLIVLFSGVIHIVTVDSASCAKSSVLIIGAGASGIAAGRTFYHNNVTDFLILEANDYIGGRMRNVMFDGISIELGAQWAHITEENHSIWKLVKQYNLTVYRDDYTKVIYRNGSTGSPVDATATTNKIHEAITAMDEIMSARVNKKESDVPLTVGLRFGGWIPHTQLEHAVEFWTFPFENSAHNCKLSAIAYGSTGDGVDYVITDSRGFNYILKKEAEKFLPKVKLNTRVTNIKKLSDGSYRIDVSGSCYHGDHVLVTASSNALAANEIVFDPALPSWYTQSLSFFQMGYYCKNFIQFASPFWHNESYTMLVTEDPDKYAHIMNLNLDTLYKGKNILLITTLDDKCFQDEQRSDDAVKADIMTVLRKAYGASIPDPIAFIRSLWSRDPLFRGAYSHVLPGVSDDDYRALLHPVGKIWFAGEHTAGVHDYGYNHGAYDTGVRQAERIMECISDSNKCPGDFRKTPICPESSSSSIQLMVPSSPICLLLFITTVCMLMTQLLESR